MARSARFFLSRINKGGTLDVDKVLDALRNSSPIESRDFAWTIVDVLEDYTTYKKKVHRYLAGKLVKYDPDATIQVVDEAEHKVVSQDEPNMQRAASLFVYFPDHAIFGHRHVWNEIRARDFRIQVAQIIVDHYEKFFVDCELLPVADMGRFLTKLAELEAVNEIKASVTQPNPYFGVFWKDLRDYLRNRRLRRLTIKESSKGDSLLTTAPEIARSIEADTIRDPKPAPMGDAAILMAADGYGTAAITGRRGTQTVIVRTSESALQLKLEADVLPAELATRVVQEIIRLESARRLEH